MTTTADAFQSFWQLGYKRLVPIIPPDAELSPTSSLSKRRDARGKAVGARRQDGLWSGFDWLPHEADEQDIRRWHGMGAGVGIKTGQGLIAIDADTLDADHARIIRDIVEHHLGRLPIRVGKYPKAAYICRVDAPYRYTRVEFGERNDKGSLTDRVEILSDGRQFVAHGIHPSTKAPYTWPRELIAFEQLPVFSTGQIDAMMAELHKALPSAAPIVREGASSDVNQDALKGELETVRKAVLDTPNTSDIFPTRESFIGMGYAIKAALPGDEAEALELYQDWCARWSDGSNNPELVEAEWRRMKPPYKRGAGYLYELAEAHSGGKFRSEEMWFDELPDVEPELNPFDVASAKEQQREEGRRFTFLNFEEAADSALNDPAPPLIKGLIDQGTMSVLYGDSNVGKTFVAMDIAYHIATGRTYGGMKTEHALVVYVASEGGRGAKRRLTALRDKFKPADRPKFLLLPEAVDLRRPDVDLNPFIASLKAIGQPVGLVIVDTLSRALAGGDENSSVDMGALVKHFDAIRAGTGAHLMIVHHTGKDKAKGARGHTLLRAATDTEIEVAEGVISVTKQRDLDKSWSAAFGLEVRTIGMDADGDKVTSCTVRLDTSTAGRKVPTESEEAVLEAMAMLTETSDKPEKGVRTSDLETWCKDNLSGMTRDALNAHLRGLRSKGCIKQEKRGFWLVQAKNESVDLCAESVESVFA
jgi:hypothetical protein